MKKYFYELMTDSRRGWLNKVVQALLWVLSLGYCVIVDITRGLYRFCVLSSYRAPKPVVSVGNITVGGVGKTPLVISLAKILIARGLKPVVLSRGYGADGFPGSLNDEAKMFKELLPQVLIMIGANRRQSIQQAMASNVADVFLADDAFQHWPLKRDLDIVTIDAANPFGNGHLIPRGILREKPAALGRADIFVLTKTDEAATTQELCSQLHAINPKALIVHSRHVPMHFRDVLTGTTYHLSYLNNKRGIVFCAIADPAFFERTLQKLGLQVFKHFTFMDHHIYSEHDLKTIVDQARSENINILVTTHKDAVKINSFKNLLQGLTVYSLDIDLQILEGRNELIDRIISLQSR